MVYQQGKFHMPKMYKYFVVTGLSTSNAMTTAMTLSYSSYCISKNVPYAFAFAAVGAVGDFIGTTIFNGKSILKEKKSRHEKHKHRAHPVLPTAANVTFGIGGQLAYSALDIIKVSAGRYFLLVSILELIGYGESHWSIKLPILVTDIFLKEMFNFTNETYESNEAISKKFGMVVPFYTHLLKPLSNIVPRRFIMTAGSLEHTICDDILPWFILIPKFYIEWVLQENLETQLSVLIPILFITSIIASLVFVQTTLFEGHHSDSNLQKADGYSETDIDNDENLWLPQSPCIRQMLAVLMNVVAVLHGAGNGAPVYLILKDWLQAWGNPRVSTYVPIAAGLFAGTAGAVGCLFSEAREAKEQLVPAKESDNVTDDPDDETTWLLQA